MNQWLKYVLTAVTTLTLVACGGGGDDSSSGQSTALSDQNVEQMASYADFALDFVDDFVNLSANGTGTGVATTRSNSCESETMTGNDTNGSGTISFNNCVEIEGEDRYGYDGYITATWSNNSFSIDGNYTMTFSDSEDSFSIAMSPIQISYSDNGSSSSTTINMTIVYTVNGQSGSFTITTLQTLTAPSSNHDQVSGKLQITDGSNTYTITYVDGTATVQ